MTDREKKPQDIDRLSDEIMEETMKGIFDDINNSEDFEETDDDHEEKSDHEDNKEVQDSKAYREDDDTFFVSLDEDDIETDSEEMINASYKGEDRPDEAMSFGDNLDEDDDDVTSEDEEYADGEFENDEFEKEVFGNDEFADDEFEKEVFGDDEFENEGFTDDEFSDDKSEDDGDDDHEAYDDGILDDGEDDDDEESDSAKAMKKHKRRKTAGIIVASIVGVLALIYIGFAIYFQNHFMFFTKINGTDFSMKSVEQVEAYMERQVADYVLTLNESDGGKETIAGSAIALEYVPGDELEKLAKEQNNFLWIESLWKNPKIKASIGVKYDENALAEAIGKLNCMVPENQTASVDAHPEFKDTQFEIIPEVVGTQIDTEKFNNAVKEAINGFMPSIDMTKKECYIKPRFVSDSPEVIAAKDAMNSYLGASITYDFNPHTEVVDAAVISQWVKVDADMNVTFDEAAVRAYIQTLADKYDTKGKTRTFTTANGNTVNVEGGSYGWRIDQEAEYNALIANIQNAETVTREANYSSRAASHDANDFGGTYAEVDLTNQSMAYVQNGQVVLQTPVVTGNPNKGNGTPQGTFSLAYKARNQVLRGAKRPDGSYEYETPVSYWMPFNGGIGFHDASWQPTYGGSRYLTGGSHGCINMPPSVAAQLYELITAGTPVIVHY